MVPIDSDYNREVSDFVDIPAMFVGGLSELPSKFSINFRAIQESFRARRSYIEHAGFPLLSREFQGEVKEIFIQLGIKDFVEIEAGTGALTTMLTNSGFKGKGYTLDPEECNHNWGMKSSNIFDWAREKELLEFKDIRELELASTPDIIVASWIPYEGGDEVLEFFETNPESDYFMVIGEGYGGCTANDEFHDWLDKEFVGIWRSETYESFNCINDTVEIYQRKSSI